MITTQQGLRAEFWAQHPRFRRRNKVEHIYDSYQMKVTDIRVAPCTQNDYPADIRMAWCDFVDSMQRDGNISMALAERATL